MEKSLKKYFIKSVVISLSLIYFWGIFSFEILSTIHSLSHYYSGSKGKHSVHELLDHFNEKNLGHQHSYLTLTALATDQANKNHDHKILKENNTVDNHINPSITSSISYPAANTLFISSHKQKQDLAYSPITPPPQS